MQSKRYYWLKLHDDFFRDNSIKRLRKLAGGDTFTIIYLKLLLLSLQSDGKLYYEGLEEDFATQVALEMDEELDNVRVTLSYLMSRGILVQNTEEEYELTTQKEMVGSESESARRMRLTRQLQKDVKLSLPFESESAQCAHNVPQCEQNVTLEIRDKRKEIRDRDKDIPPLTPPTGVDEHTDDIQQGGNISATKRTRAKKAFVPPTLAEVEEYVRERQSPVNPKIFWEYFDAGDWTDSEGKPVQNWKQKLITWEKKDREGNNRGLHSATSSRNQARPDRPHIAGKPLD